MSDDRVGDFGPAANVKYFETIADTLNRDDFVAELAAALGGATSLSPFESVAAY